MPRIADRIPRSSAEAPSDSPERGGAVAGAVRGEDHPMSRGSLIHAARRVATFGLLGAALSSALPLALPALGVATIGAATIEGAGLLAGLATGLVLVFKHQI